jgi:hypothetical protein
MLREESQRRLKAARQKKWAEYRLAKEAASGRPMRRSVRIVPMWRGIEMTSEEMVFGWSDADESCCHAGIPQSRMQHRQTLRRQPRHIPYLEASFRPQRV